MRGLRRRLLLLLLMLLLLLLLLRARIFKGALQGLAHCSKWRVAIAERVHLGVITPRAGWFPYEHGVY